MRTSVCFRGKLKKNTDISVPKKKIWDKVDSRMEVPDNGLLGYTVET